jgi:xanthine dehydrogenase accessory factor
MQSAILSRLNELRHQRKAAVVVTHLDGGVVELIAEGERPAGDMEELVALALRRGTAGLVEINGERLFLNVYLPPVRIVVIGAVHISQVLAPMARLAGFDLQIIGTF